MNIECLFDSCGSISIQDSIRILKRDAFSWMQVIYALSWDSLEIEDRKIMNNPKISTQFMRDLTSKENIVLQWNINYDRAI